MNKLLVVLAGFLMVFVIANCSHLKKALAAPPETPTQERMKGIWNVVKATDENDSCILSQISKPVCAISFGDVDGFLSTAEPMAMYIVYGSSKATQIGSAIDQYVNYVKLLDDQLPFNPGDWVVATGVVDRFTLRFRLKGLPGQGTLSQILGVLGIGSQFFSTTVYHQFQNVSVSFNEGVVDTMRLALDDSTVASYYTLNSNMDKVNWLGLTSLGASATSFHKCKFVLAKQTLGLDSLVRRFAP